MASGSRKLLRFLGFSVYGLVVVVVFVASAYGAFNLFVTSGATRVPEVVGLEREEAADRLADSGLEMTVEGGGGRYDPEVPAGHVIEQSPAASSLVKRGAAVGTVVSLGPQRLTVPELEGKSLQSAQVTLAAGGLTLGPTLKVFRPGTAAGVVVTQDPEPGTLVSPAAEVRVFLTQAAGARRVIMPDLIYRDYDIVRAFFERAGLRLGRVTFEIYEGAREGTILRQFPLAGHPLTPADAVSLVVAAGAAADDLPGTAGAISTPRPGAPPARQAPRQQAPPAATPSPASGAAGR
jgi:serine/threonine-protein kinase